VRTVKVWKVRFLAPQAIAF